MDSDFVNIYIRKLVEELTELHKQRLIMATRLEYTEETLKKITKERDDLLNQQAEAVPVDPQEVESLQVAETEKKIFGTPRKRKLSVENF